MLLRNGLGCEMWNVNVYVFFFVEIVRVYSCGIQCFDVSVWIILSNDRNHTVFSLITFYHHHQQALSCCSMIFNTNWSYFTMRNGMQIEHLSLTHCITKRSANNNGIIIIIIELIREKKHNGTFKLFPILKFKF